MGAIQVGLAVQPMAGETACADRHLVREDGETVLVAALDGVGHGVEAERAAMAAVRLLGEAPMAPLMAMVTQCHQQLRETRGVVMSLASLDLRRSVLTWLGVGNVTGVLFRSGRRGEYLVLRGGVVGHRLPLLWSVSLPIASGDTLVFATDGVANEFELHSDWIGTPQRLAERILAKYGKGTDDAMVLVVRYLGPPS